MKTITLKADAQLDKTVTRLARSQKKTKSAIIREAIMSYEAHLKREMLMQQVKRASLVVRKQSLQSAQDLENSIADGL